MSQREHSLANARKKREALMKQCADNGIVAKPGYYSKHKVANERGREIVERRWHGPTTISRMRRKLKALGVTPCR